MSDRRSILVLILFVAICLGVSVLGAWSTAGSVATWYPSLRKPSWNPPAWVFGPVWTALYIGMAIAAWLVWRKAGWRGASGALVLFAVQLVLNAAWSPLFFGLRSPLAGLVDIVLLWLAIAATLVAFYRISPLAGALLVPYGAWVSFATALNAAIWRLNR
jgi:tryptophan-rich sensory protein